MLKRATDVLIIGGGGAGLRAALAARKKGVDVTLIFKSGGNATLMAAGGHSVVLNTTGNVDSLESHYQDTMESGDWLNDPNLVKKMVEEGPREVMELVNWGVNFIRGKNGELKSFRAGGHSHPRSLRCEGGTTHQLYRILYSRVREAGVKIVKNFQVIKLLKDQYKIHGAVGMVADKLVVIEAKAVILASGGLGQLYQNTTNPPGITGEGYILGLEAGAALIDMEFIQFIPTTLVYPPRLKGEIVTDTLRGEGAVLLNDNMERFMVNYAPEKLEVATRDVLARAIYQEIIAGRGTENQGVYLDARNIERERMLQSFTNARRLIAEGIDPSRSLIEVAPSAHFCCGGILIDSQCFTGIEGLWAVGEVTGGVHGGNRLGANALTEVLVFGRIAGENAANWAKSCTISQSTVETTLKSLEKLDDLGDQLLNEKQISQRLFEFETRIKAIIWQGAGISRNEADLKKGLDEVAKINSELEELESLGGLRKLFPLWSRLLKMSFLGKVILVTALKREESRGTHFRLDYPRKSADFNHSIKVTLGEDRSLKISKHFKCNTDNNTVIAKGKGDKG